MQKIMIDSSTWVSFLAQDCNSKEAKKLLNDLLRKKDSRKIVVPSIIYLEVINTLRRLDRKKTEIQYFMDMLKEKPKIQLVKTDEKIYRKAARMSKKIRLKSLDLLILTTALQLKVDQFYTFDKKLKNAYKLMKTYEKVSKKKNR